MMARPLTKAEEGYYIGTCVTCGQEWQAHPWTLQEIQYRSCSGCGRDLCECCEQHGCEYCRALLCGGCAREADGMCFCAACLEDYRRELLAERGEEDISG